MSSLAYKILTVNQWAHLEEDGLFAGSPDDIRDGYIHLSDRDQIEGTLERHFAGQQGLELVEVDLDRLGDAVRHEESRGGERFPHLYDGLPIAAVTRHWTLEIDRGAFLIPHDLRHER